MVVAPTSRLAGYMRARLGEVAWAAFVRHADRHYKDGYVNAFRAPTLRCVGRLDGTPCPHAFEVNPSNAEEQLKFLHLDHERPVHLLCEAWANALPPTPASWDDGVDGGALCHDLFGVDDDERYGARRLRFRCGPRVSEPYAQRAYCHLS